MPIQGVALSTKPAALHITGRLTPATRLRSRTVAAPCVDFNSRESDQRLFDQRSLFGDQFRRPGTERASGSIVLPAIPEVNSQRQLQPWEGEAPAEPRVRMALVFTSQ